MVSLSGEPMTPAAEGEIDTLILGIGNLLWADEGFGIRALEALNTDYDLPAGVRLLDGGTQGIFLLPWISVAHRLLIFDAIDFGLPPGTLRVIYDDQVPSYMGAKKVSMHQTGFQEVLASARLIGDNPQRLALIGVQPELLDDYGGSLRPSVKARLPDAVIQACSVLQQWGLPPRRRDQPLQAAGLTGPQVLEIAAYEEGRPVC